jgi:hypothetical protein
MRTQTRLNELDATKMANFRLREQLLVNEYAVFKAQLMATYGNPDEDMQIAPDNSIIRQPRPAPPAPKGKGARKPGNR